MRRRLTVSHNAPRSATGFELDANLVGVADLVSVCCVTLNSTFYMLHVLIANSQSPVAIHILHATEPTHLKNCANRQMPEKQLR